MRGDGTVACPACGAELGRAGDPGLAALAEHLVAEADASDGRHVMWLNRNLTKRRTTVGDLTSLLRQWLATGTTDEERVGR